MRRFLQRVVVLALLAGGFTACAASERPAAKAVVSVEAVVACAADIGYVVRFRITNTGRAAVRIPDDLLPWSPAMLATHFEVVGVSGQRLPAAGIMGVHSWGATTLESGDQATGELPLEFAFESGALDALLAQGDATLRWRHSNPAFERSFDGALPLHGQASALHCERGSSPETDGA